VKWKLYESDAGQKTVVSVWLVLLLRMGEASGSNFGPETGYSD
jgi:hypothetical protein